MATVKFPFNRLRLQAIRKRRNETQEQVAHGVGVSLRAYAGWEIGERSELSVERLKSISDYWGVDMMYFLNQEVQDAIVELQMAYEDAQETDDPQVRFKNALNMLKAHATIFGQTQRDRIDDKLDQASTAITSAIEQVLGPVKTVSGSDDPEQDPATIVANSEPEPEPKEPPEKGWHEVDRDTDSSDT